MVASVQRFQSRPTEHALAAFNLLEVIDRTTRQTIRRSMFDVGSDAERYMVRRLTTGQRTGRFNTVRGRIIRASAPGEFPAKRTGRLARSARYNVRGAQEVEVGVRRAYGAHLEFGTRKMERRPFIEPTSNQFAQTFATLLYRHAETAMHRGRSGRFS